MTVDTSSLETSLIDIDAVTDGTVAGKGSFDVLMRAISAHLDREFKAQRITGNDYAQVYLNAMQTALQTATTFNLQAQESASKTKLLKAQTLQSLWQSRLLEHQVITEEQKFKAMVAETALTNFQVDTEKANTVAGVAEPGSLVDKQATLLQRQADGFLRDAEQKAAQNILDVIKVRISVGTTDAGTLDASGLTDANMNRVVQGLMAGANL